ncbi:methyl-accepting chemotaxis protein [Glaciecola sp. XM2]|jgi:methyl-accepting chemotaxis protein|uniref:methyl-accepting chemotaxis protein n=1 Tax=Glaciecola sp. XM2 TaxID=1914931 RepID=UPI001BDDCDA2|nr:methyl-accepting chemotaxis protein [Glaciecola sp. XM2]MBT1452053.1 methyl-accepting chemotaxis protein [Glaciecola sp. XM2]
MTIKRMLTVSLAILTFIIIGVGAISLVSFSTLEKQNNIYNSISSADNSIYKARLAQADFLVFKDASFAAALESELGSATKQLQTAKSSMKIKANISEIDSIIKIQQRYERAFNSLAAQSNNESFDPQQVQELLSIAKELSVKIDTLLENERLVAQGVHSNISIYLIIAIVVGVLLSIGLGYWLTQSIVKGINMCTSALQTIATGDFATLKQPAHTNDEFGQLLTIMNGSTTRVRDVLSEIKLALDRVAQSNIEVDNAVADSTSSMNNQKMETESLASAITELSAANEQIAHNAKLAADTSQSAGQAAVDGDLIVKDASAAMAELSSELDQASVVVDKLNEDSDNIANILDAIRSIAEQTNLLALNAAIEAARAGEQGRGFAVVADEVRTLAARTQNSVMETTSLIEHIQKGARDVVNVMTSSNTKSSAVMKLTEEASVAYANITHAVNQLTEINQQVAMGADEQTKVTHETSKNVERIANLADTNARNLHDIEEQTNHQTKDTNSLVDLLSFFKI